MIVSTTFSSRSRLLARCTKQLQRNRCLLSTAHGYYYSDVEEEEKNAGAHQHNKKWIAKFDQAVLRYPSSASASTTQQQQPLSFEIHAPGNGAHVVLGANATGKSLLGHALAYNSALVDPGQLDENADPHAVDPSTVQHHIPANALPSQRGRPSVATVSFESHERLLQQGEMSVYQALTPDGGVLSKAAQFLVVRFGLYSFLTRLVHTLSTGEIRKVLLIRALARRPQLLVLDNAFDGLDVASRDVLQELVRQTTRGFRADILVQGVDSKATARTQIVLLTHRAPEIGDEISRVTFLSRQPQPPPEREGDRDGTTTTTRIAVTEDREGRTGEELLAATLPEAVDSDGDPWDDDEALPSVKEIADLWSQHRKVEPIEPHHDASLVHLYNFSVKTKDGTKELISNLTWNVQQGQRWLVAGGNGAGKSTLSRYLAHPELAVGEGSLHVTLSPAAVGWVSTERHMSMARSSARARDVLLGLDRVVDDDVDVDEVVGETVARWLHLRDDQLSRPFAELSQGEQKMVLIGSAIAKLPKLLIIDEPLQGLDLRNRRLVLGMVERLCRATDTSLIYVTHHFEELVPSVSHVVHLKEGASVFNDVIAAYDPGEF